MSDRRLGKVSEYMPWNAMVGITRSKVIFIGPDLLVLNKLGLRKTHTHNRGPASSISGAWIIIEKNTIGYQDTNRCTTLKHVNCLSLLVESPFQLVLSSGPYWGFRWLSHQDPQERVILAHIIMSWIPKWRVWSAGAVGGLGIGTPLNSWISPPRIHGIRKLFLDFQLIVHDC